MKSTVREAIEAFFSENELSHFNTPEIEITTREEAEEFCDIFEEYLDRPKYAARLLRLFRAEECEIEGLEILRDKGTPLMLQLEPELDCTAETAGSIKLTDNR